MLSNAQRIRERFKEVLEDGNPHTRQELFDYAKNADKDRLYSEGMLTGALKTLVDDENKYKCISRATYQKVGNSENRRYADNLIGCYISILKNTLEAINREEVDAFAVLEFNEDEKKKMKEIQICIRKIQSTINSVEE